MSAEWVDTGDGKGYWKEQPAPATGTAKPTPGNAFSTPNKPEWGGYQNDIFNPSDPTSPAYQSSKDTLTGMTNEYLRQNRFKVVMIAPTGSVETLRWYEKNVVEVSTPSVSLTPVEWWQGAAFDRSVSKAVWSNITMSVYLEENADPFFYWIKQHVEHVKQGPTLLKNPQSYKRTLLIILLDNYTSETKYSWQLEGCQLQSASVGQLSASSDGAVLVGTLDILPDRVILMPDLQNKNPFSNKLETPYLDQKRTEDANNKMISDILSGNVSAPIYELKDPSLYQGPQDPFFSPTVTEKFEFKPTY